MNGVGGQESYLPALHPAEVWKESGRWDAIGDDMFRLKDRKGADMCLGHDSRRDLSTNARNEIRIIQQTPAGLVSNPDKVSDRSATQVGLMRPANLHHEKCLLFRC